MAKLSFGNRIDRAIGVLSPERAARRMVARAQINVLLQAAGGYEGAARSHRFGFQNVGGGSANTEIRYSLPFLRERSRDLGRNNPYAANVFAQIPAQVVGAGIIPTIEAPGARRKKALQGLIKDHLDTPKIDFDGRTNLAGIQALAMRTVVEAGEVLVVRHRPPSRLKLPVPLQVRVLEPDYLDERKTGTVQGGNFAFAGIEFDADGRRVAYWIFDEHPGGGLTWKLPQSSRIPAEDVIHVYRVDRPGQARGVPWGAPVIVTMKDLAEFEDAELLRQKIAACYSVIITGSGQKNLAQTIAGPAGKTPTGTQLETVEPGTIMHAPDGVDVKFGSPPTTAGYPDFTRVKARQIAVGFSVPYEIATGDLSQVTFISGRLGWLQFAVLVDQWRWQMLIPHLCDGIGGWFLEAADIALGGTSGARLSWTPPRRQMISPKDEIPAIKELIRSGLSSRSAQTRELGDVPEEIEDELAAENKRGDAKKLRFDSDGRFPANTRGTETLPLEPGETKAEPSGGSTLN